MRPVMQSVAGHSQLDAENYVVDGSDQSRPAAAAAAAACPGISAHHDAIRRLPACDADLIDLLLDRRNDVRFPGQLQFIRQLSIHSFHTTGACASAAGRLH